MPRFRFKLEPALFQRRTHEEVCQRELAKVLRQRMILLDQLRQMQETISQSKGQLGQSLVGQVDLDQTSRFARYSGQVTQRAQQFVAKLAVVERKIQQTRGQLVEATRQRKALERLRDRRYQQWQQDQIRREDAQTDELSTQRYARRLLLEGKSER